MPSDRLTAEQLLQKVTFLAPSSTTERAFRAQIFASMRFNDHGPMAEAKLLRRKLAVTMSKLCGIKVISIAGRGKSAP